LIAQDYTRYPDVLRSGGVHPYQAHDSRLLRSIAKATQSLPRMFLDAVLPELPGLRERLEAGVRLLDVGCGGGYALVACAERYPHVRGIGLDVEPTSIRLAQALIHARGLGDRLEVRQLDGAVWPADLMGACDLVTTFLVLHEIRPELKAAVLQQCAQALRPWGEGVDLR
jgi:SAM-dependent methyltransferase